MYELNAHYIEDDIVGVIHATPETIDLLVVELGNKDGWVREQARLLLVYIGEPAVAPLIGALSDRRKQVRWEAAKALSDIADPASASALVEVLQDRVFDIRWLAAVGLIAIGRAAVMHLLETLTELPDSTWVRQGAHHVLHDLDADDLEEILQPVLKALESLDPEVETPVAAEIALLKLKDSESMGNEC
jgi:HEAT repeat protein